MEYTAPPIKMHAEEESALPRMRGAVPFPAKMTAPGGSAALPPWMRAALPPLTENMPFPAEESILPPPSSTVEYTAPTIEAHAEEGAPPRMRGAVPFSDGSAALPPWMRGAVPLPGKMAEESDLPVAAAGGAAVPLPEKATISDAFQAINEMAGRLGIEPGARDRAKDVFRKMDELKGKAHHYYTKGAGRSGDALYAACLYVACRSEGAPRTFKELAAATRDGAAARKDIGKLIGLIRKRLGDEVGGRAMDIGVVRAADYMDRFGALLGMEEQEVRAAQEAARRLQERLDVRRNPDSTAAAIIYMAIDRMASVPKSFRDVSLASGVAEGTIKQAYRELCPHAELLFG